LVFIGYR